MFDETFIRRTFALAQQGIGRTFPNPMVGAVIVKNGKIIGEGYHQKYGGPHAEVEAFNNCSESPEGATLYVNLEPCCHTNKQTPPCAQRVLKEKIKKVVICNLDPNPDVNGKGVELLRQEGVEVVSGILDDEGEELNEVFFTAQRKKRPFVHLKLATTLDGKIALPSGESQWITGEKARLMVHEFRAQNQAVAIGAETLRKDNPALTVRLPNYQGPQPLRLVFTETGLFDPKAKLFIDEHWKNTWVYTKTGLKMGEIQAVKINSLEDALQDLYKKKVISVFLEGGSRLATSFLAKGLVDRVSLFLNPSFMGEGKSVLGDFGLKLLKNRPVLNNVKTQWLDGDLYLTGKF